VVSRKGLENFGACELISEMLDISEELAGRPEEEFDEVDTYRVIVTIYRLLTILGRLHFQKLSLDETRLIPLDLL